MLYLCKDYMSVHLSVCLSVCLYCEWSSGLVHILLWRDERYTYLSIRLTVCVCDQWCCVLVYQVVLFHREWASISKFICPSVSVFVVASAYLCVGLSVCFNLFESTLLLKKELLFISSVVFKLRQFGHCLFFKRGEREAKVFFNMYVFFPCIFASVCLDT